MKKIFLSLSVLLVVLCLLLFLIRIEISTVGAVVSATSNDDGTITVIVKPKKDLASITMVQLGTEHQVKITSFSFMVASGNL